MTTPFELREILSDGLLSFPVTDFDAEGRFNARTYAQRLEWLAPYGASALFAAGGTGELFSLSGSEYGDVIRTAVQGARGQVPILAGAGGPTNTAIAMAREAEAAGAAGLLLLPHYLTEASEEGIAAHVSQVCQSTKLGVVFYARANSQLNAETLARLADRHPNLIGFKDGLGDIEKMVRIRRKLGDRFSYLGGLPTAEVYAEAYRALGVPVYSSAVFNFIPKTAVEFFRAVSTGDTATTGRLLDSFFLPYLDIRNRRKGYAVSIVKAGAKLVGHDAGPVRAPLTDLTGEEMEQLKALIDKLGPQ
ncbi:5-dehydro-4-deoxyglucarate dehydratase [Bordetella ansorpii]|uniref:Probable 5-dehydro-4-deoxyglucarate dehydratase n=1 Tax=Bordetella ansorpii TaxID=288768 RepID=A0A157S9Y8_9BORD|nr:5-dehydro-4-deoxyglucarate dehydratase [Bordetella ansorpii]SAI67235.1 5-dehydro-4-deoxyglucarate dehydratase [Bordetella ansorpii]